jgi:hypothetical protein
MRSLAECPREQSDPRTEVAPFYTKPLELLAYGSPEGDNQLMRPLAVLLIAVMILFGAYEFYLKKMPTTDQGTAPTQAISLTGVRADLLKIAEAERTYMATNGQCVTLEELVHSNSLSMDNPERAGYSYSITCSGSDFTVFANHAPAPSGSPIRYPNLATDQTMEVRELN